MTEDRRFRDADGELVDLVTLCRREPQWAANRIAELEMRLIESERRNAFPTVIKIEGHELRGPIEFCENCSRWDPSLGRDSSENGGCRAHLIRTHRREHCKDWAPYQENPLR
jgi:hypothetical protein